MNARTLIAIALVALVSTAGVAIAAPPDGVGSGNAPDDVPRDDHADDGAANADDGMNNADENASDDEAADAADEADDGAAAAQQGSADRAERGPPADLPEPVPDRVSQIHDLIRQYLDGGIDDLGERISAVAGGQADGDALAEG